MKYCVDEHGYAWQLQRCPFCGMDVAEILIQSEQYERDPKVYSERYTIVCNWNKNGCGATCGFHDTISDAVSRWNTRVVI